LEITPPDCSTEPRTPCTGKDWVQCAGGARLICIVHDDPVHVRYAGRYAANTDNVCTPCGEMLYEQGELARIRGGYQYTYRC
jgi:hypothetical protein